MASVSLATLRTRVQQLGNYENSARFTPSFLNDCINAALFELYELLSGVHEGYFDITATLSTTTNVDNVALPADFWRLRGVDVALDSTRWLELRQISIAERNRYSNIGNGRPFAYRIANGGTRGQLTLYPTPDAVYQMRVFYEPTRTALAADGDSLEDWNGWADYVVHGALLRCDEREKRPTGERLAKLEQIKQRIITGAGERRAAEPEYLVTGRDTYDPPWGWGW